jgi:lysophospholipase L1-like esterase
MKPRLLEVGAAGTGIIAVCVLMGWPTAQGPYVPSNRYFLQCAAWTLVAACFAVAAWRAGLGRSKVLLVAIGVGFSLLGAEGICRLGQFSGWGGGAGPLQPTLQDAPVNSYGLREREAAPPGPRRLVLGLGDSFTYGQGVKMSQTFLSVLEQRYAPDRLAFVNAGIRGAHTANEAALLARIGWPLQPTAIIVQFTLNDAESGPYQLRWLTPWPHFEESHLRRSHLFFLLVKAYNQWVQPYDAYISSLYEEGRPGLAQMEQALQEIGTQCAQRRVPAVLLLFPMFTRFENYPYKDIHAQVRQMGEEAGFTVVDLLPTFLKSGHSAAEFWATPQDPHPNAAAHTLAAEAVLPVLRELKL